MSYQERRAVVGILGTVLISGGYLAYMLPRQPIADAYSPEIFRFWGTFFLILIGVSIIVRILITIVFSILNAIATRERDTGLTDERDKLIELKASRNGFYMFVAGFVLAMIAVVMDMPPSTMFMILMIGGVASELVSDMSEFWFYRWGI
jgi:uncharacterized membrane protein